MNIKREKKNSKLRELAEFCSTEENERKKNVG